MSYIYYEDDCEDDHEENHEDDYEDDCLDDHKDIHEDDYEDDCGDDFEDDFEDNFNDEYDVNDNHEDANDPHRLLKNHNGVLPYLPQVCYHHLQMMQNVFR